MVEVVKGMFKPRELQGLSEADSKADRKPNREMLQTGYLPFGEKMGFEQEGNPVSYKMGVNRICALHRERMAADECSQNERKSSLFIEKESLEKNVANLEQRIFKIKEEKIPLLEKRIELIDDEIEDIAKNPDKYVHDEVSKLSLIVGGTILFFLSIYLFVFYSSASYSSFFKIFNPEEAGVVQAIFDAQALNKAWIDGVTELIFILTIPFVFLGLGFLIHKFSERKDFVGYLKIFFVLAITFVFDSILAYEITKKLYEIKRGAAFEDLPEYTTTLAVQEVNFWMIIFAGFIVYIVWGFVFDFFAETYRSFDKVGILRRAKRDEKKRKLEDLDTYNKEIQNNENTIDGLNHKISEVEATIKTSVYFPLKDLEKMTKDIATFTMGWTNGIKKRMQEVTFQAKHDQLEKHIDEVDQIHKECVEKFIQPHLTAINRNS